MSNIFVYQHNDNLIGIDLNDISYFVINESEEELFIILKNGKEIEFESFDMDFQKKFKKAYGKQKKKKNKKLSTDEYDKKLPKVDQKPDKLNL